MKKCKIICKKDCHISTDTQTREIKELESDINVHLSQGYEIAQIVAVADTNDDFPHIIVFLTKDVDD